MQWGCGALRIRQLACWIACLYVAAILANSRECRAADVPGLAAKALVVGLFANGPLGVALRTDVRGSRTTVELCFDVCDYFEWESSSNSSEVEIAWTYLALFEYGLGVARDWESYRDAVSRSLPLLLAESQKYCLRTASGEDKFSCDWKRYSRDIRLKSGRVTYDEGLRCFEWRSADGILGRPYCSKQGAKFPTK